ncbi:MAG: hypothetical protein PHH63_08490, partial [Bacteroidales bacterium]|nr:hypothetical protein [Bacteroidales bacterium]
TEEKRQQELASFRKIDDSFRKIVITGDDIATYTDEQGIIFMVSVSGIPYRNMKSSISYACFFQ